MPRVNAPVTLVLGASNSRGIMIREPDSLFKRAKFFTHLIDEDIFCAETFWVENRDNEKAIRGYSGDFCNFCFSFLKFGVISSLKKWRID